MVVVVILEIKTLDERSLLKRALKREEAEGRAAETEAGCLAAELAVTLLRRLGGYDE